MSDRQGLPDPFTSSSLFEGAHCRLVPITPEHYETLRYLEAVRLGIWWRGRGTLHSPDEFARRIWDGTAFQSLAVATSDSRLLLWLQCYAADPINGTANLAVARLGEELFSLRAASGFAAFVEYCFTRLDLRKLYMEVAGPNFAFFERAAGPLFVEEGRLAQHVRGPDGYEDLILLALWRDLWELSPIRQQLLTRF